MVHRYAVSAGKHSGEFNLELSVLIALLAKFALETFLVVDLDTGEVVLSA